MTCAIGLVPVPTHHAIEMAQVATRIEKMKSFMRTPSHENAVAGGAGRDGESFHPRDASSRPIRAMAATIGGSRISMQAETASARTPMTSSGSTMADNPRLSGELFRGGRGRPARAPWRLDWLLRIADDLSRIITKSVCQ